MNEETIKTIFSNIGIKVKKIESANNSYNSNVYIIYSSDNKYILKISNDSEKRINECKYYNYLSDYVHTSKVLASGIIDKKEYNIITFLEGKNVYDENCNELSKSQIYNIGELLGKIHNCALIDEDNDSWINYLKSSLDKAKYELFKIFGVNDNDILINYITKYIDLKINNNYNNSILHMDFRIGNIILAEDGIIGVIDLESMKNGDSVFDFVKMNRIFNHENFCYFVDGYKNIREIDKDFDSKLKFYSLFDSYTSLFWCVNKGQLDTDFYKLNYNIVLNYLKEIKVIYMII